jgi:outer membrane protein assembly factor BamB
MRSLRLGAVIALAYTLVGLAAAQDPTLSWTYNLTTPQTVINPFTMDFRDTVLVPTNTSFLVFQLSTGTPMWNFTIPAGDSGGYASGDQFGVYLGTTLSVYAFEHNGTLRWTFALPQPANKPNPPIHARVDVGGDDMLFVTTGSTPILAVRASNGSLIYEGPKQFVAGSHSHPIFDRVFYNGYDASGASYIVAMGKKDGKIIYNISNVQNFEMGMAQRKIVLIILRTVDNMTMRFDIADAMAQDPNTAPLLWNRTFAANNGYLDYYFMEGGLYLGTSVSGVDTNDTIWAVDMEDGSIRWNATAGFDTVLAGDGGVFAFGTSSGTAAFDAYTGHPLWTANLAAVNDGAAALNHVVFGTATQVVGLQIRKF